MGIRILDTSTGEIVKDGFSIDIFDKESGEYLASHGGVSYERLDELYDKLKDTHRFIIYI